MQTNVMTSKKSSGCGCGCGASKGGSCGCGGKGCSICESPPEAYSRPQFFSGQLLTEDDLQSLADHTVAKNRLHNRMLFGEGVVCGLRVNVDVCEPERHLVVRPGYAIDCCGNDIVVPCEARLDVVQLVRDLRTRMLGKDCGDPCRKRDEYDCPEKQTLERMPGIEPAEAAAAAAATGATVVVDPVRPSDPYSQQPDQKRNSYCLYVVYCEQPADPVAPYDGADTCGGGECRHTRVREGYRFELRCGTPSGCEPRKLIEPKRGVYGSNTLKARRVFQLLSKADKEVSLQSRKETLDLLMQDIAESVGPYQPENMKLVAEARGLGLNPAGQARFNSIVAWLLIGWLRSGDCDSFLPDCPPCDEDGVLIACFDFEDCKVSNLCVHRRQPILSPAYFTQLGLTNVWRCLLTKACCPPGAAPAEMSIKDLENFLTERLARIDDADAPESRFTLLPELARAFGAQVTRASVEATVRDETLHKEIADLRKELAKVKAELATMTKDKVSRRKGGNT
jgi:hypothetical protein